MPTLYFLNSGMLLNPNVILIDSFVAKWLERSLVKLVDWVWFSVGSYSLPCIPE